MKYQTGKKEQVIELLKNNSDRSLSMAEICDTLLTDGHGRSTIYRLVSSLVECGTIRRLGDGKTRHITYQYVGDEHCKHHLHLKCKSCGRLIHLDEGISEGIKDTLVRIGGFQIDEGEMLLGRCNECKGEEGAFGCHIDEGCQTDMGHRHQTEQTGGHCNEVHQNEKKCCHGAECHRGGGKK